MKGVDPRDVTNAALELFLAKNNPDIAPELREVFEECLANALRAYRHDGGTDTEINNLLIEGVRMAASLKPLPTEASV